MIAEEISNKYNPSISVSNTNVVLRINELMLDTIPYFKSYLISGFHKKKNLNEEDLTQFFTKQA